MTRLLYNPAYVPPAPSNGAPKPIGKAATEARNQLGEYLDANLTRSLYSSDADRAKQIETSLNTMTPTERVFLEIEKQERTKVFHSFSYDPLR